MTKQRILVTNVYDRLCFFLEDDGKITEILVSDEDDKNGASVQVGDIYIGRIKRRIPNIHAVFIELFPGMECYCTEEETACACFTKKTENRKSVSETSWSYRSIRRPSNPKSLRLRPIFP